MRCAWRAFELRAYAEGTGCNALWTLNHCDDIRSRRDAESTGMTPAFGMTYEQTEMTASWATFALVEERARPKCAQQTVVTIRTMQPAIPSAVLVVDEMFIRSVRVRSRFQASLAW